MCVYIVIKICYVHTRHAPETLTSRHLLAEFERQHVHVDVRGRRKRNRLLLPGHAMVPV